MAAGPPDPHDWRHARPTRRIGPSGSGKSTLGALLAGIDRPTSGSLVIDSTRIDRMKTDELAAWRGRHVGIVFQDFHLLPTLTVAENVELAIELSGAGAGRRLRRSAARAALAKVGLGDQARKLFAYMSGGEQQRVGIARAMVTRPPLIVADEPTGALDQTNGRIVFELLTRIAAVMSSKSVSLFERRHELATLKALGASKRRLRGLIVPELAPIAALGVAGGLALGALGNRGIIASFETTNAIDIGVVDAVGWIPGIVAGTFVTLVVLSVLIVRSSSRRPIAVTLRGAA